MGKLHTVTLLNQKNTRPAWGGRDPCRALVASLLLHGILVIALFRKRMEPPT